jgi:hypothetical protein
VYTTTRRNSARYYSRTLPREPSCSPRASRRSQHEPSPEEQDRRQGELPRALPLRCRWCRLHTVPNIQSHTPSRHAPHPQSRQREGRETMLIRASRDMKKKTRPRYPTPSDPLLAPAPSRLPRIPRQPARSDPLPSLSQTLASTQAYTYPHGPVQRLTGQCRHAVAIA